MEETAKKYTQEELLESYYNLIKNPVKAGDLSLDTLVELIDMLQDLSFMLKERDCAR